MIVKNCPAFVLNELGCASHKTTSSVCEKNENCIMKQFKIDINPQEVFEKLQECE